MKGVRHTIEAPKAWGFVYPGENELLNFAESKKPSKKGRAYSSAFHAFGYRPVPVRVIREADFRKLMRLANSEPAAQK